MAQSKDDITIGTAQARVSEDDALRVRYKAGTPLEGGMIAESEPVDLFSSAHNVARATQQQQQQQAETGSAAKQQMQSDAATSGGRGQAAGGGKKSSTGTS